MTAYIETSAAAKLLVEEAESAVVADHVDGLAHAQTSLVSSMLMETELRRLAVRAGLAQSAVSDLLDRIDLVEPNRSLFYEAGVLGAPDVRSLDALHIATALRLEADQFIAYDIRQCQAAISLGLRVVSPSKGGSSHD